MRSTLGSRSRSFSASGRSAGLSEASGSTASAGGGCRFGGPRAGSTAAALWCAVSVGAVGATVSAGAAVAVGCIAADTLGREARPCQPRSAGPSSRVPASGRRIRSPPGSGCWLGRRVDGLPVQPRAAVRERCLHIERSKRRPRIAKVSRISFGIAGSSGHSAQSKSTPCRASSTRLQICPSCNTEATEDHADFGRFLPACYPATTHSGVRSVSFSATRC